MTGENILCNLRSCYDFLSGKARFYHECTGLTRLSQVNKS
jgi:hypothetical protein